MWLLIPAWVEEQTVESKILLSSSFFPSVGNLVVLATGISLRGSGAISPQHLSVMAPMGQLQLYFYNKAIRIFKVDYISCESSGVKWLSAEWGQKVSGEGIGIAWRVCQNYCLDYNSMNLEAKEQQIYEDLSMILQLVRKKLTLLVSAPIPSLEEKGDDYEEQQADHLLLAFIGKYRNRASLSRPGQRVIERFFCRIKELANQFLLKMPRNKLHLLAIVKVVEQFTAKSFAEYNNSTLVSLLKLSLKQEAKNGVFRDKFPLLKGADRIDNPVRFEERAKRQMNQVEQMQKNAELYSVIDIDPQHFRGNYFDIKNDQGTYVQNEMVYRNRYIKQIITTFQIEFERYKKRELSGAGTKLFCCFKRRSEGAELCESLNNSRERFTTLDSTGFTRTQNNKRKGYAYSMQKRDYPISSNGFQRQSKMAIDTFRSLFQQKLNEKKQKIKLKNVMINLNESETKIKGQFLNAKRREFFKKSQDQIKFRYKYYNYKSNHTSKSSIKYRTINPQSTFNTIDN